MGKFIMRGWRFVEGQETATHEVEFGEMETGGHLLIGKVIRSFNMPEGDFLIASITDATGKMLWSFKQEEENLPDGYWGVLKNFRNELIIVIKGNKSVLKVIPVSDLLKHRIQTAEGEVEFVGGKDALDMVHLKEAISKDLGLKAIFSDKDSKILRLVGAIEREKEEREKEAREKARQERLKKILARPPLKVFSSEGIPFTGVPATEEEWRLFEKSTPVVLVASYDDSSQKAVEVIEFFFVARNGSVEKHRAIPAFLENPLKKDLPKSKGTIFVPIDGKPQAINLFEEADIALIETQWSDIVTYLAIARPDSEGRYSVIRLKKGKREEVGMFSSLV